MKNKYFKIQEFVSKPVYDKYGDKCWEFLNPKIISFINILREDLGKPITINDWLWGGQFQQRGLRANKDPMVVSKKDFYLSQHCLGNALDFNVKGMTTKEVQEYIVKNYDKYKNYITRMESLESSPTWVHIDCSNTNKDRLIIFKA